MTLRLAQLGAVAALAVAAASFTASPAGAFTIETLGNGNSDGSTFSDPDGQVQNFGQGMQLLGPGGPTMQFGVQQGMQSPFGPRGPLVPPGFASPRSFNNGGDNDGD